LVESQPSKLLVAGSSPVSRSAMRGLGSGTPIAVLAHVAQSVEHILGKDEVTGSIPVVGSFLFG
jgi:hypothetical protein